MIGSLTLKTDYDLRSILFYFLVLRLVGTSSSISNRPRTPPKSIPTPPTLTQKYLDC
jgi:hypothetical protein